jgi:superfamily II DNA or RNA helicase
MKQLNLWGSCLLSVYPGFGKTIISIRLACKIRLKTLIIINKVILLRQWEDSIREFVADPVRVRVLTPGRPITDNDTDADFYLVNAMNVYKMDLSGLSIGLVIVDECHLIMTSVFSYSLTFLTPRYLIGLSATPYRSDGFDRLLDLYFGTDRIHRRLYREHEVLVIQTGYRLDFEEKNGKIVWNSLLHSQMVHEERNRKILCLVQNHPNRNVLVLCKRIEHVRLLNDEMRRNGIATSTLIGNQSTFDPDCRVLLASIQKAGTGFSFPKLDMLILACDCEEYYVQYMCRVMRTPEVIPIIVDIVDEHPSLKRHFRTRKKVYEDAGGTIRYLSADDVS